jgi:pyruvate/2-oxoglutarate dehydrogenase complex dihydrolipoamide dehydrogenase (E3) component
VQGLGLEEVGVALGKRGLVLVNEKYQTSVPNIYAAGDVIGFPALASTSMEQARVAMVHAFNLQYKENISSTIPLAVYAIPEISAVGLTEDECKEKNIACLVGRASYENSPRGQIIGDTNGMIKLVFAPIDKRLLGAHIIGEQASELIHIAARSFTRFTTILRCRIRINMPPMTGWANGSNGLQRDEAAGRQRRFFCVPPHLQTQPRGTIFCR